MGSEATPEEAGRQKATLGYAKEVVVAEHTSLKACRIISSFPGETSYDFRCKPRGTVWSSIVQYSIA